MKEEHSKSYYAMKKMLYAYQIIGDRHKKKKKK